MNFFKSPALLISALVIIPVAAKGADPDSLQARINITAIAYDDGFGGGLKTPAGISCDSEAGEVYVADAGNGRVVVYDRFLNCKFTFHHYVEDRETHRQVPGEPKAIAVNRQGEMLLIDGRTDILDLLDFRGRVLDRCRPSRLLGDTTLQVRAICVTVDERDRFYMLVVGDVTRILVLDENLKLLSQMGESGDLPSQFKAPTALAVHKGRIYVGDMRGTPAIKIYDSSGHFLSGFSGHDVDRKDLSFPVGFGFLDNGSGGEYLLVADALRQVIKVFTLEGEFFTAIGGMGIAPGLVQYPSSLASDGPTAFYTSERVGGRIQRYEIK